MEKEESFSVVEKESPPVTITTSQEDTTESKNDTTDTASVATVITTTTTKEDTTKSKNDTTETAIVTTITTSPSRRVPTGKKRGAFGLFRAALFTFGYRRSTSKKAISYAKDTTDNKNASNNEVTWKTLVGGVRPLHLHQLEYYPSPTRHLPLPPPPPLGLHEVYHDVVLPPPSPARSSASDGMSRYASAEDLQELARSHACGQEEEEEEEESNGIDQGNDGCPNAIDVQAEEFIANFYAQMRRQSLESIDVVN